MGQNGDFERIFRKDKEGFQSGVSDCSVGRFGGFREDLPLRTHHLTFDAADFSMHCAGRQVFYVPLPKDYRLTRGGDWSASHARADFVRHGRHTIKLCSSLIAPAMHLNSSENFITLRLDPGLVAENAAYPLRKGMRISSPMHYLGDGQGRIHERKVHGPLKEPWVLVWLGSTPWSSFECPLLLVLEHQPEEISTSGGGGVVHLRFRGRFVLQSGQSFVDQQHMILRRNGGDFHSLDV